MRIRNLITAALAVTMLAGAASGAMAETRWQANHPRRAEVNHRLANQNRRIAAERLKGQIAGRQALGEKRQLNREENRVSREIGR